MQRHSLLEWHLACGVDEALEDTAQTPMQAPMKAISNAPSPAAVMAVSDSPVRPVMALSELPAAAPPLAQVKPSDDHAADARAIAAGCRTLAELKAAVEAFDGCALKKTAQRTVFADGNPEGDVLVIGEAPGADEDRQGIPFCGVSGQLLDKMLAAIGLTRQNRCYISNMVYWRPPGNRTPSAEEITICLPFVQRAIHLFQPKLIILAGASPAGGLLGEKRGITRIRGQVFMYASPHGDQSFPVVPMFHPSYLLRSPEMKRYSWQDLLMIQERFLA